MSGEPAELARTDDVLTCVVRFSRAEIDETTSHLDDDAHEKLVRNTKENNPLVDCADVVIVLLLALKSMTEALMK